MTMNMRVALLLILFAVTGCAGQKHPSVTPAGTASVASDADFEVVEVFRLPPELEPCPELDAAVRCGQAQPAGPVNDENCRLWTQQAEVGMRIVIQEDQILYLGDVLQRIDEYEVAYLERVGSDSFHTGQNVARQMQGFRALRDSVSQNLTAAHNHLAILRRRLDRLEDDRVQFAMTDDSVVQSAYFKPIGDKTMSGNPFPELAPSAEQQRWLAELGIRDQQSFVFHFYLAEQHRLLAEGWGITPADAKNLVERITRTEKANGTVTQGQLDASVREANRVRQIRSGVLPPDTLTED